MKVDINFESLLETMFAEAQQAAKCVVLLFTNHTFQQTVVVPLLHVHSEQ